MRVAVSNEHAEIDLSKKFGALNSEAVGLLRLAKQHAKKIGLSFHVGSQCMHPISYSKGINEIGNIIKKTKRIIVRYKSKRKKDTFKIYFYPSSCLR